MLFGILVFYCLFYKEKLLWKKQSFLCASFFVENWVLFESRESEFLQREASSGSRSKVFFFFFWGEIWKIGCSLNLESFNSYKGKQALGVVEVVFVFMGNLENWVLF